jgi:hypothetical protein
MNARLRSIVVASKRLTKIMVWIERAGLRTMGDEDFDALRREFAGVPERALRQAVRETGLLLAPLVEGVRQDTFENLSRTLIAMQGEYEAALAGGNLERARHCRSMVMMAKDHARLASRKRPEKLEMVEWMRVWLENPPVFDVWCKLKKHDGC